MYRLIFWPVLMPSFLFAVGSGAMLPVMVLALLQLGASEALASATMALFGAAALVVTVPVGALIDRVGDKRAMTLATASSAVLFGLTVVALANPSSYSLPLFVGALVLQTPASVAWNLARQAILAESVPTAQRGLAMTALGGTMRAGNLVGPLCGALLLLWLPLWSVFVFGAAMAVVATGMLYVKRLNRAFDAHVQQSIAAHAEDQDTVGVRWAAVTLAGLAMTALTIARIGQPILIALWGVHLGWSEAQISFTVALGSGIELLLMLPGGHLKDAMGRAFTLVACLLVYGSGFALAPLWPTSAGFVAAVVVMSIGNGLGAGINMTIGADLSPVRGRAKFLSIWAMFSQGGALGGPLLISGLLAAASLPTAMFAVAGIAGAGAVWMGGWARFVGLPGRAR
ncbi:MFS transporter [Tessaracoccus lubricantis]|uniref:MFS transporter n=1 Tax=Tessaracoccus lubricantis TaxID=545543 RepID=A0ABP9F2R6_9ACTN